MSNNESQSISPALQKLALNLSANGPHKIEPTSRRVRALFDGQWVLDTTSAKHVWEHKYFPHFYVPFSSIQSSLLTTKSRIDSSEHESVLGATITGPTKSTANVLVFKTGPLEGLVKIDFGSMDAWFEEDLQIYDHPKSPYTRIDILPSSRKIEVHIGGDKVAECSNPMFLFETGLRTRYYLPKTSVNQKFLRPSETTSKCPYKGLAKYYDVVIKGTVYKDVVWWYEYPTTESAGIQGLVCFYNEKVDIFIDGVLEQK